MSDPRTLEFWFDPASTYAYLSAMRIEAAAGRSGITVAWRPFLLGPIFKEQGWDTSPFNVFPAKGRYMVRDIERLASLRGLPQFRLPDPFPAHSVQAARVALIAADHGIAAPFMRNLFTAAFADGRDVASGETLRQSLAVAGAPDPEAMIASASDSQTKDRLRHETQRAVSLGIFGAPSFVTPDGELFWGDDRLDAAIDWAAQS